MAASRVLIDTSIIIEYLRKQNKAKSIFYQIVDGFELYTSTIVEFEIYAGELMHKSARTLNRYWCGVWLCL